MNNKKIIRKELVKNQFTSIHLSILNDKRLTSNAFRLITSILSDNDDTFKLSQTVYCNRLGWEPTMFKRAMENLIECGYVKRIEISKDKSIPGIKKAGSNKKIYFYTISEYGNLKENTSTNNDERQKKEEKEQEVKVQNITYKTIINHFNNVLETLTYKVDTNELSKYLLAEYKEGRITKEDQLTNANIIKIMNKHKVAEPTRVSDKRITEILDESSNGLTQQAYKAVLNKIINRVKNNPSMTENEIANKIAAFKTEYRKPVTGNQD